MAGVNYSNEEKQFLINNYAHKNSVQLSKIWFEKFGVQRTPQALRCLAKRICKGFELNRVGRGIRICKYCGKEFYADNDKVYHNVKFCSRQCFAHWKLKENEKRLNIKPSEYKMIYQRDKNYIENSFHLFSLQHKSSFDDLIAFFWEYQFKYYTYFCKKWNKRISLKRFLTYAYLKICAKEKKDKRLFNKLVYNCKIGLQ